MSSRPLPETVIEPQRGWLGLRLGEMWSYRDLLLMLAWRHVQVRYKQAVLGGLWAILQPVLGALAFTLVFKGIVGSTPGVPYLVFAYSGVLLWQLVASNVGTGSVSLVDNAPLITKVFFPRILIPLSVVAFTLVDFMLGSVILAALMVWFGLGVGPALLALPLAVLGTLVCAFGVSTLLAALAAKYRDFRFIVPFMVQMWFFLTPVIYPPAKLPERVQDFLILNPMTGWLGLFRTCLLGEPFDATATVTAAVLTVVVVVVAVVYFRQVENSFADII